LTVDIVLSVCIPWLASCDKLSETVDAKKTGRSDNVHNMILDDMGSCTNYVENEGRVDYRHFVDHESCVSHMYVFAAQQSCVKMRIGMARLRDMSL